MSYKMKNIFCLTALALLLSTALTTASKAQGVVTLAGEAAEEDPALKGIPDEVSLFDDDEDKVIPLEAKVVPAPKEAPVSAEKGIETPALSNDTPSMPAFIPAAPAVSQSQTTAASAPQASGVGAFGGRDFTALDDNIFSTMSNLEKQTAVLDLELRKERLKNEIEALINQRKAAVDQEAERQEAKRRQKIEWEKAQEAKVIQEQQKLREMEITFERLRQEKMLNAYKTKMLEAQQQWVAENTKMYEKLNTAKKERQTILDDAQSKFTTINTALKNAANQAAEAKAAYLRDIADMHTQISVLKARIEAQEKELLEKQNPFAEGVGGAEEATVAAATVAPEIQAPELKLPNLYAVMEIRGQGDELIAKLINQDGTPFYVKKGTSLQSGHIVDEITSTYVRADKNGMKDYLYFAAGGILPMEVSASPITLKATEEALFEEESGGRSFISSDGVPGMGSDMMAR